MNETKRHPHSRSMVIELPLEMADRLEYARYVRQKNDGRPVPKKQLVLEALDRFLRANTP